MPRYLLSVFGPAERTPFGVYGSQEEMREAMADTGAFNDRLAAQGSKACRGKVEVRPFETGESLRASLGS